MSEHDLKQAEAILVGEEQARVESVLKLAKRLKNNHRFGIARRVLERAEQHDARFANLADRLKLRQQLALCTSRDRDLPAPLTTRRRARTAPVVRGRPASEHEEQGKPWGSGRDRQAQMEAFGTADTVDTGAGILPARRAQRSRGTRFRIHSHKRRVSARSVGRTRPQDGERTAPRCRSPPSSAHDRFTGSPEGPRFS